MQEGEDVLTVVLRTKRPQEEFQLRWDEEAFCAGIHPVELEVTVPGYTSISPQVEEPKSNPNDNLSIQPT
jgi:hypothetical protein